jgi:hypothetical protein
MNQIAALAGGGLVASATLIWPKAPVPRPGIIALAWGALALATVTAVLANYLSALATGYQSQHGQQAQVARAAGLGGDREVVAAMSKSKGKSEVLAHAAARCGTAAPLLFAAGVGLVAAWAVLAILP